MSSSKKVSLRYSPETYAAQVFLLISKEVESTNKRMNRLFMERKLSPEKFISFMEISKKLEEIAKDTEEQIKELVGDVR